MGDSGAVYRLLGELEIGHGDNSAKLPGGRTLILLAVLLINANRRMPKAQLIRAVWDDDETSEAQLHKHANKIRGLLTSIGRREDLQTYSGFGYEMHVASSDIDTLQFRQQVAEAGEARSDRRAGDEARCLRQALQLWRGPHPLSNVPGDAFRKEADALEQRRKQAAVRLFDLELANGDYEGALDGLLVIADLHPSDRRLCEQLMLAQYRCGHRGDADRTYERYERALEDEAGLSPDPVLRELHFAIARDDEAAVTVAESAVTRRAGVSAHPVVAVPRQLPRPPALVGRVNLAAEVKWLLSSEPGPAVPVIVISGPAGIGKTALAVRAAQDSSGRYPDGQLYMELHGTTSGGVDTGEILAQFLRAFELPQIPETTRERLSLYRTVLADRRVLVVLDDATDGTQVNELAPANPGCALVVTARQRLPEINGAHHVAPLGPLNPAESTELFLRVVADAGVDLQDDLAAVDRIVNSCGGLPLALRIAGALRAADHTRPAAELADRLAKQQPEDFKFGQLNVARAIEAGLEPLAPGARQLFLGLGLVRLASFGLWTAAALLDHEQAGAAEALSQLAARFIAEPAEADMRYRFHDLTREYARSSAHTEYPGDRDAVPSQVYQGLLTLARRAHAHLYGGDFEVVHSSVPDWDAPAGAVAEVDAAPLDWFEKERLNIRAAVTHCAELGLTGICWDLAVSTHEFYTVRGYFDDWHATHTVALAACREAGDRHGEGIVLACLNQPALVASRRTSSSTAVADLQLAADLLADCQDRHGQAIALRTLGNALRRQGHISRPIELFNEALGHYAASRDTVGRWQTLRFIGQTLLDRDGGHEDAFHALEQAQALANELGRERLTAQTSYWLGRARLASGDIDGAQSAFGVVFEVYRDDTGLGHAYAMHGLGDVATRRGSYNAAEQHFAVAGDLAREGGDAVLEGFVWLSTAELHRAQGQHEEQAAALEQAAEVFKGCGAAYLEIQALAALAQAKADLGDAGGAGRAWAQVDRLYEEAAIPEGDRVFRGLVF